MTQKKNSAPVSIVHPNCCGLDVHKEIIVATLISRDSLGERIEELREFSTFTDSIFELKDWLLSHDCPIVSMESTGVYWRPIHNILEGHCEVILVNARHYKNVPGRKTDVCDSQWLGGLLEHGLLRGSFIPPCEVRQWRELNRLRRVLVKNAADYKRRTHKVFETANIKIDSVVSDLFGMTGRNLIKYLLETDTPTLAGVEERCCGSLVKKAPELYRAIQGFFGDHQRQQLKIILNIFNTLELDIAKLSVEIRSRMSDHESLIQRLDEVPGIDIIGAQSTLAELGFDLASFRSSDALCSWAGVSPGNNESAGKRLKGKNPAKKHRFREILVEMAWAATRKKGSFWKEKYYRLKARMGARKAIVAIAHKMLNVIYYIIKKGKSYHELGEGYLKDKNKNMLKRLKKQAKMMGFELTPVNP